MTDICLDSFCQRPYATYLDRVEGEQREVGCLKVISVARDVHNETQFEHNVQVLMQSSRQADAAHDSVSTLRTEGDYTSLSDDGKRV